MTHKRIFDILLSIKVFLRSLIDNDNPVIILRGWYNDDERAGGHFTIIYDYHWYNDLESYVYDIYDPSPVNVGSYYECSYQAICNGQNSLIDEAYSDNGIWEGIVVYEYGDYNNTIDWIGS